jgi:putative restriction endonuclease
MQLIDDYMSVRLVVAITDRDWFEHLRHRRDLPEINFWAPSGANFKALSEGELFLFKLHAPNNFIVGGGVFTYANVMPCSLAWEAFGEANGASTLMEMRSRIAKYRKLDSADRSDFQIGCRILTQPFFLDESRWIAVPASWSRHTQVLKRYSTEELEGLQLWEAVQGDLNAPHAHTFSEPAPRFGEPVLIRPRLGQGEFRILVTDIYKRRCAVTKEKTLPALDAAHIRPYAEGGLHDPVNGLLLRRDIHSLFDAGYVTVTPDFRFEVSSRIREEFENGREYYALHGATVAVPESTKQQPDRASLVWHNEERFLG